MNDNDLNRLKVVLAERKRTGAWLAQELKVSPVTVSKWCSNISQPTLQTLKRIANALDVNIKDLLNNTEKNHELD